jgi:peptidoglycan hydrolase-like protein with peptidoglycan-binding domain
MRKTWVLAGAAVLVTVAVAGGVMAMSAAKQGTLAAQESPPNTAQVVRGKLSATVLDSGTLTYRARADGSPYSVINQARGTYTKLPDAGEQVDCGGPLYRVDEHPVLLLCGAVPAYRDLLAGNVGEDVRQLNRNLHTLGYDTVAGVDLAADDNAFTSRTEKAVEVLQQNTGFAVTGKLAFGDALFLPEPVRIAQVTGKLGGSAQPGTEVAQATSDRLEVQMALDPSQQGEVKVGAPAQIVLPGNKSVPGKVDRLGRVAQIPAGQDKNAGSASIPAYISLDDPKGAAGLDRAAVRVVIATAGVESALSVPVTALVGRSGGGFAVDVVRDGGRRELVAVRLGLFDAASGRVQVDGDLAEGDRVVVPAL